MTEKRRHMKIILIGPSNNPTFLKDHSPNCDCPICDMKGLEPNCRELEKIKEIMSNSVIGEKEWAYWEHLLSQLDLLKEGKGNEIKNELKNNP